MADGTCGRNSLSIMVHGGGKLSAIIIYMHIYAIHDGVHIMNCREY